MITAVAYARYSSDRQREESIDAQLRAIKSYALKNDISIVKTYIDEAESATTDDRHNFQKMINELPIVKPNFVLTHKFDRFARNRYDSAIYKKAIQDVGARYVAVDQPIDNSPEGIILESVLEGMSEYYSRNLAREVMKGMKENAVKAKFNGGRVPLGFDINKDKHYIINDDEAVTIKLIYSMKLTNKSYGEIAEELNRQGRTTKAGKPFGKNSLYEILRNEKYCGTYAFNKIPRKVNGKRNNRITNDEAEIIIIEDAIPAIISKKDWEEVQKMMDNRKMTSPRKRDDTLYMLTGVLKCPECGSAMVGSSMRKKNKQGEKVYYYYRCSKATRTKECTNLKQYPKNALEELVLDVIESRMIKPENMKKLTNDLWEEIQLVNYEKNNSLRDLQKQLNEVDKKINNYMIAIEKGLNIETIVPKINEATEIKKNITSIIEENKSPFSKITKKEVQNILKNNMKEINKKDLDACAKIISETVEYAIIRSLDDAEIKLRYDFGMYKNGVGRLTLPYTYQVS